MRARTGLPATAGPNSCQLPAVTGVAEGGAGTAAGGTGVDAGARGAAVVAATGAATGAATVAVAAFAATDVGDAGKGAAVAVAAVLGVLSTSRGMVTGVGVDIAAACAACAARVACGASAACVANAACGVVGAGSTGVVSLCSGAGWPESTAASVASGGGGAITGVSVSGVVTLENDSCGCPPLN